MFLQTPPLFLEPRVRVFSHVGHALNILSCQHVLWRSYFTIRPKVPIITNSSLITIKSPKKRIKKINLRPICIGCLQIIYVYRFASFLRDFNLGQLQVFEMKTIPRHQFLFCCPRDDLILFEDKVGIGSPA